MNSNKREDKQAGLSLYVCLPTKIVHAFFVPAMRTKYPTHPIRNDWANRHNNMW